MGVRSLLYSFALFLWSSELMYSRPFGSIFTNSQNDCIHELKIEIKPSQVFLPIEDNDLGTLSIINPTDTFYTYGPDYYIDYFNNGKWQAPLLKKGFTYDDAWEAILLGIPPHSKKEVNIGYHSFKYIYKPGKYRIEKVFTNTITKKQKVVYAEFNIQM